MDDRKRKTILLREEPRLAGRRFNTLKRPVLLASRSTSPTILKFVASDVETR
jgi:hypothetical protein